ncbi:bifunctional 2',3'-cyclic-nucleotide 2'-phosphodiesterase/3'-nucleotidase [Paenibacillus sp. GCM10023252]|uniref:bifunctional 2',3'-cyclic-nucleotide 2'-phosphodiesterase/3'-nucleotidase n=1 Tax=Paenibacillus sp. GCM10023252 TaxID=3252649 RepID=UPI00361601FD
MSRTKRMNKRKTAISAAAASALLLQSLLGFGPISSTPEAAAAVTSTVKLRLMETTDVHTSLMDYDYYKDTKALNVGLVKTATLVKQAREEAKNTVLIDNGDLIQGTPLGTYMAKVDGLKAAGSIHPVYKAMNLMGYDVATYGNHEFNYGLDFLDRATAGAKFPYVNANIYKDDNDSNPNNDVNKYKPYLLMDKKVKDENGQDQTIQIGILGLVTPQIMEWDKAHLDGKVITKDIAATAKKFVPEMEKAGADIIVAVAHTGFDKSAKADTLAENAVLPLSEVDGIDAITFSHTHKVFPAASETTLDLSFKDSSGKPLPGIDNAKGTINGVAAVQAGFGGANLGLIDLTVVGSGSDWSVSDSQSSTKAIYDSVTKTSLVEADPAVVKAVASEHASTIKYANEGIGETTAPIYSYFALVQDDPSIQIVTNAQKWYVENYVKTNVPKYKDLPILSVGAPFKAGRNGPSEYTDIAKGPIAIKGASDLYLYDNTLKAIKVTGATVKEWLEMSAGAFNQIDAAKTSEQPLLNPAFAVYNYDVIDGVTYQIDVTKPAKYKADGTVNDAASSRIVNHQFGGKAIDPKQEFIVVSNNYRVSGGGNFPGVKGSELVVDSADENRQVLMDYIAQQKTINPGADDNWSFAPVSGSANVTFTSAPAGEKYLNLSPRIKSTGKTDDKGFAVYSLSLKPANTVNVQILGINDFHGQLDTTSNFGAGNVGGAAYLATYLMQREAENPNTLLVHNGDSVGASAPVSSMERDKPTIEYLNLLKFDVGSIGNHEFDYGLGALRAQLEGGKDPLKPEVVHDGADFPHVNANAVDADTGKPLFKPYVVKEVGGVKVGFIGVVTMATVSKVSPASLKGVKLVEQAPVVNAAVKELQAQGVKAIVVLAHDPASVNATTGAATGEAIDLANAVDDEVDVIFAGDNHAKVNTTVDNKLIVQAYSYGTAFADIELQVDKDTGDIVRKSADIVDVKQEGVKPNAEVEALVNKYLDKFPVLKQPVGTTKAAILRENAYNEENALGNLIADAMKDNMKTDFSFMNPGGIRNDLPKGDVKFSDLAKIQPFGNTLVKMTLTGAQVRTLLQQQWAVKADGTPDTKTLQISGLKYTADFNKPVEERVTALTKEDGTKIEDSAKYTVVVNNFMAAGGDNYKVLTQGTDVEISTVNDLDAFYNYIVKTFKGGEITSSLHGRVTNIPADVKSFEDVSEKYWAYGVIRELVKRGVVQGVSETKYAPERDVTRAEFAALLAKYLKLKPAAAPAPFSDVAVGSWYASVVASVYEAGIVEGKSEESFEPSAPISREEIAVMMTRVYEEVLGKTASPAAITFSDLGEISSWAKEAVELSVGAGLMKGRSESLFVPAGLATRAEAAQVIHNLIEK